jgi:hypothetical protein
LSVARQDAVIGQTGHRTQHVVGPKPPGCWANPVLVQFHSSGQVYARGSARLRGVPPVLPTYSHSIVLKRVLVTLLRTR